MKIITLELLRKTLKSDAKISYGCGIFVLGFLAMVLLFGSGSFSPLTVLTVLGVAVFGISMISLGRKTGKNLKKNTFYLTTEVCRSKELESIGEDSDCYILIFENGLRHNINHNDVSLCAPQDSLTDAWLFNSTEPGDRFYLLYLEGASDPEFVLNQRLCQLDKTGFVEENGRLRPRFQ